MARINWREALRAVERLGVADEILVYAGALNPLVPDPYSLEIEQARFGYGKRRRRGFLPMLSREERPLRRSL